MLPIKVPGTFELYSQNCGEKLFEKYEWASL